MNNTHATILKIILPAYSNVPALRKLYKGYTTITREKTPKDLSTEYNLFRCKDFSKLQNKLEFLNDVRLLGGRIVT